MNVDKSKLKRYEADLEAEKELFKVFEAKAEAQKRAIDKDQVLGCCLFVMFNVN